MLHKRWCPKKVLRETSIQTSRHFPLPVEQVFDYVTTSGNWPSWHPASQSVRGQTHVPMQLGEQVIEHFRLIGYRGVVTWTVNHHDAPYRWRIEGVIRGRVRGVITYKLTPADDGTLFERTFVYLLQKRWESLIDFLLFRRFMAAESSHALHRLREVMLAQTA